MNSSKSLPGPPSKSVGLIARRIQYRVGHGGFHATVVQPDIPGSFDSLVYVYDVGAGPDVYLLEGAIKRFLQMLKSEGLNQVDYVILSHMDEDHVSRFDYLLTELRRAGISVRAVMLPWLRDSAKLIALTRVSRRNPSAVAVNLLQSNGQIVRYTAGMEVESVIFVRGEAHDDDDDDDDDPITDLPPETSPLGTPVRVSVIASGSQVATPGIMPWTMIVTHLEPSRQVFEKFDEEVKNLTGLDPTNQADHAALIRDPAHRRSIRRAMSIAAKAAGLPQANATITNWSSLSLYSSSTAPFARHDVPQAPDDFEMECEHGWLHTGDLPLDVPDIWSAFDEVWDRCLGDVEVCVVTAPHHGSMHGHSISLYERFKPSVAVFNLGLWAGSSRGRPRFAKWVKPMPAMREIRLLGSIKVRLLNNRI